MNDVRDAIATATDRQTRNAAIRLAVTSRGKFPDLDDDIVDAVNSAHPMSRIMSEKTSGLPGTIYDVIKSFGGPTDEEKNDIMKGVKGAIDDAMVHHNRTILDQDIDAVVKAHNNYAGLFNLIKDQTDASIALVNVKTRQQSSLPQAIYDIIADPANGTPPQRNAIMDAVRSAATTIENQGARDSAITDAVDLNGKKAGLAAAIIAEVNTEYPLGVILKTLAESRLPQTVYDVIKAYRAIPAIRNTIMEAVQKAMTQVPKVQALRSYEIGLAIKNSVGDNAFTTRVLAAVDAVDPIGSPAQRAFVDLLSEYSSLPTEKKADKDLAGNDIEIEVKKPRELLIWKRKVERQITSHVAAYVNYQDWLDDFKVLSDSLKTQSQESRDLASKFETAGIKFFKAALDAEALRTTATAEPYFIALRDEIKDFLPAVKRDRAQWQKDVYQKLDGAIKNFKPELLEKYNLLNLIDNTIKIRVYLDDLRFRLEAANLPFQLVKRYTDALQDLLRDYKQGSDWHTEADPKLSALRVLGKNTIADDFVAKFTAAASAGPEEKLKKVEARLKDFEKDFAKFYDMTSNTLVDVDHPVNFQSLKLALSSQAKTIDAFKASKGRAWEKTETESLNKRKEDLAIKFLVYSSERFNVLIKELEKLRDSAPSGQQVVREIDTLYKKYVPIEDPNGDASVMLRDLAAIIQAPTKQGLIDVEAKILAQQTKIDSLLVDGGVLAKAAASRTAFKTRFESFRGIYAQIADKYNLR